MTATSSGQRLDAGGGTSGVKAVRDGEHPFLAAAVASRGCPPVPGRSVSSPAGRIPAPGGDALFAPARLAPAACSGQP